LTYTLQLSNILYIDTVYIVFLDSSKPLRPILHPSNSSISIPSTKVKVVESVRNLRVIFDNQLSLSTHVTVLCRSGYFQLRQLRPDVRSLITEAVNTMIQAVICCHLDYCNSLLYGVSDGLIQKLQSVQNAAARLITGARRCDHISHVRVQLHWLPVRRRVEYKVACLVHQSVSGQAPAYF